MVLIYIEFTFKIDNVISLAVLSLCAFYKTLIAYFGDKSVD